MNAIQQRTHASKFLIIVQTIPAVILENSAIQTIFAIYSQAAFLIQRALKDISAT